MPNDQEPLHINRAHIYDIISHFKGKPVNNNVLLEYCNRKGYDPISEGVYQDWLFQFNHDARMNELVPAILQVLTKYQHVPEALGEAERKKLIEANEGLEIEICKLLEDHDILYQEIDIVTQNLGSILQSILASAGKRANNMVATMFAHIAKEKYGDPLKVRTLGEAYREHASVKPTT